jgi:hypothetical protein
MKLIALLLVLGGAVGFGVARASSPAGSATSAQDAQGCCKVCSNSQACGDSCISWDKMCHKGAGCACQG